MSEIVGFPLIEGQNVNEVRLFSRTCLSDPSTWVSQYGHFLLRCALSRVRHIETAEDLVQETFLAALKSRHTFIGESSEKTWLTSILKRKVIDHYRSNKQQELFGEFSDAFDGEHGHDENQSEPGFRSRQPAMCGEQSQLGGTFVEWKVNPDHCAQQHEFWKALQGCLTKLSPRVACAFWLREIEQLDTKEICDNLNVSESNLWVMLHRARRCLRECLQANWLKRAA
jgi:RNA polymerase sigma-70 factor (TIGR02943 family)